MVSHLFFETNLEKNILTPDNKLFSAKERKKKIKKTPAKLYSLSSQAVRKNVGLLGTTILNNYEQQLCPIKSYNRLLEILN